MIPVHMEPVGLKPDTPWLSDDYVEVRRAEAVQGSRMLRDAILRARGLYTPAPAFRKRPVRRVSLKGKPRGWRKPRFTDMRAVQIQEMIAEHYGISSLSMRLPTKKWRFAHPRQEAMYLIRKKLGMSLPDIGLHFGGRDHTTILHAIRQVEKRVAEHDEKTIAALHAVYSVLGA